MQIINHVVECGKLEVEDFEVSLFCTISEEEPKKGNEQILILT